MNPALFASSRLRGLQASLRAQFAAIGIALTAFQFLNAAAATPPGDSGVPRMKALFHEYIDAPGRLDEILKEAIAVADAHPAEVETLCLVAWFQCQARKLRDAEATIDRARRLEPNNPQVYVALAELYRHPPIPRLGAPSPGIATWR